MTKTTLDTRQRVLAIGAIVALALAAGYVMVVRDLTDSYRVSERTLNMARERLRAARMWSAEVQAEQQGHEALAALLAERGSFDLFSYTNQTLQRLDLREHASLNNAPRPNPTLAEVEVTVRGVTLEQLVNLLHEIQGEGRLVAVRSVVLQPAPDERGLVCSMRLATPRG